MPSTLSTQREAPAKETAPTLGWSSLPNDLIHQIGDYLLADEDVESYMDFRSVCKGWRDPTMGPKELDHASKPGLFLRSRWALHDRHDDVLTFVNVETGRFLTKNIPLLRNYFFVGATGGGMIILEEPIPPYQVRVLNPFTGLVLRFKASLPKLGWVREAAVTTSPMMLFISGKDDSNILWADESSEHFHEFQAEYRNTPISMAPFGSKVYLADRGGSILSSTVVAAVGEHSNNRSAQTVSMAKTIRSHVEGHPAWDCYLVKSGEELLLVTRPWYSVHGEPVVRKVDIENNKLDLLGSIGNRALFLSDVRCLSVDANKFHGIEGGCIYFVDPIVTAGNRQASLMTTFRVDEQVQDDIVLDPVTMAGGSQEEPFTLSQVFANYCMSTYYSERGSN